jgi:hypothetical protein
MIKLLDLILEQNRHLSRIYLSWDAASWHISKRLSERIASNNVMAHVTGSTSVELAPLPAGAQFLNVIESVFSGMARAVIHSSDYQSKDDAKAAIDRYFCERNRNFRLTPQLAGKRIWARNASRPPFPRQIIAKIHDIGEVALWPETEVTRRPRFDRDRVKSGHNSGIAEVKRLTHLPH